MSTNEINTQNCVNGSPCTPAVGTPCASCGSNTCSCQPTVGYANAPYYNQACAVEESHTKIINQQTFVTALATAGSFNMPSCEGSISIIIPGLAKLQVGSYLWNITYGYLEVTGFNVSNGTVTLKNNCNIGNAAPGTTIPACTMFNVVDPPYAPSDDCGGIGAYLTANFVIPIITGTVNISVNNLEGITVNGVVQVGSGSYLVTAIVDSLTITIQNTGSGGTPGTTVYAKDVNGNCITPVTPYSFNPCTQSLASQGSLIVCSGGVAKPLDATANGQVPVVTDASNNIVEFQPLSIPIETCTVLTACLVVVSGTDSYVLEVEDNSIFTVGMVIWIHWPTIEGKLWAVTNVNGDGVHVSIQAVEATTVSDTVSTDTNVCVAPCCYQVQYELKEKICDQDWSAAFKTVVAHVNDSAQTGSVAAPISPATNDFDSETKTLTIENPTCNTMHAMVVVTWEITGSFAMTTADYAKVNFFPHVLGGLRNIGDPPLVLVPVPIINLPDDHVGLGFGDEDCMPYNSGYSKTYTKSFSFNIPSGQALQLAGFTKFRYEEFTHMKLLFAGATVGCDNATPCDSKCSAGGTGIFTIDAINTVMEGLGVAVQGA